MSQIAFHEKAGRSQVGSFIFLVGQSSSTESPLSPPFHPQSLMSILLAASWVFSFQPVLPPVSRPLFVVNDEAGQAIDAVTGTRRLELCLSFLRMLLFYAATGIAIRLRLLLCHGSYTSPLTHK